MFGTSGPLGSTQDAVGVHLALELRHERGPCRIGGRLARCVQHVRAKAAAQDALGRRERRLTTLSVELPRLAYSRNVYFLRAYKEPGLDPLGETRTGRCQCAHSTSEWFVVMLVHACAYVNVVLS